jgi:hypothetical protein
LHEAPDRPHRRRRDNRFELLVGGFIARRPKKPASTTMLNASPPVRDKYVANVTLLQYKTVLQMSIKREQIRQSFQ